MRMLARISSHIVDSAERAFVFLVAELKFKRLPDVARPDGQRMANFPPGAEHRNGANRNQRRWQKYGKRRVPAERMGREGNGGVADYDGKQGWHDAPVDSLSNRKQ